jgi:hypothetical protein
MKKHFLSLVLIVLLSTAAMAQTPVIPKNLPQNPPNPNQITPRNLRLLGDLTVSCGSLVCKTTGTITTVTVKVTVNNAGENPSGEIKLRGLIAPNPSNKPTTDKPPTRYHGDAGSLGAWKPCTTEPTVPAIAGRGNYSHTFEFKIPAADVGNQKYIFFSVLADYYQSTSEVNETNNMSAVKAAVNTR